MKKTLMILFISLFLVSLAFIQAENSTEVCDSDNLELCLDETTCTDASGYWYEDICNVEEQATSCESDDECEGGYECEDDICILEEENDDDEESCTEFYECENGKKVKKCKWIEVEDSNGTEIGGDCFCVDDPEPLCQLRDKIKEKNRLRFEEKTGQECTEGCTCNGAVMKCETENGREMTIFAGKSGNVIFQFKGVNVSTKVDLYKENGTIFGNFKGNNVKEIKFFPDEIKAKLKEKMMNRFLQEEIEVELEDDGNYKFKAKKKSKLFWVIPVNEGVTGEIDVETGQFVKLRNGPWWGFLANDVEVEIEE